MSASDSQPSALRTSPRWTISHEALMVWMSLLAYSFLSAPLPALNEPHYLAKAKHYWQPEWCAGDLFLESANAHVVFYQTLGWLTLWLPLPVVAVIGRGLALGLVAIGWTKLVRQLLTQAGTALFALWFFLALQAIGNWSGEWIVGGVESKVFTYGFFFWSLAAWCEGRLITAAALAGLGISFHPVVGIWGVFAILGTMLWELCRPRSGTADFAVNSSKIWGRWAIAVNVFVLTALPGLWPAIQLITAPVDATTRYAGTYIQVFYRLAHHLDPMLFPTRAYVGYLGLIVLWIALQRFVPASLTARRLNGVIIGALIFALCGIVIGYGPRPPKEMPWFATRMHLLKFYPFRLADALVPCGMAWGATAFWWRQPRTLRQHQVLLWSVAALTLGFVTYRSQADRIAKAQDPAWQEVCTWFRETQPRDILVQTPHDRYTFKWYAARPEYVTFKDCPQDAPGIVEWNRRMLFLAKWYQQNFTDKFYSTAEMQEFHEQTGITHVVTDRLGPFEMPPVMESGPYRVYDLRSLAPAAQPAVR